MDPSMLAAAALQARNKIVKNQGEEVITTSDRSGGGPRSSFQKAPSINFSVPKTAKPEKPADWKKPDRKYGGSLPNMTEGPGGAAGPAPVRPDLSSICDAVVQRVKSRKERITTPGYCMKVRDSCPLPCCQYLHQQNEEPQQTVIIKKVIRRRRPKQQAPPPEQNPGQVPPLVQETPPPLLSSPPPLVSGPSPEEQQAEAHRRQQQQQEAERRRQAELQRQQQEAERRRQQEEYQRQQQAAAAAEAERQRQAAEEQRRQQAAAAAAAAQQPPAPPQQKVATFQNLGTDPTMAHAELYYESTRWGPLGHGSPPVSVGTFPGHRWFIVANGTYAKLFTVGEEPQQTFTF